MRSVTTKEMEELRKTRKAIEKGQTPSRYVATCARLAVNMPIAGNWSKLSEHGLQLGSMSLIWNDGHFGNISF